MHRLQFSSQFLLMVVAIIAADIAVQAGNYHSGELAITIAVAFYTASIQGFLVSCVFSRPHCSYSKLWIAGAVCSVVYWLALFVGLVSDVVAAGSVVLARGCVYCLGVSMLISLVCLPFMFWDVFKLRARHALCTGHVWILANILVPFLVFIPITAVSRS
jgi:hypothetical protein